MSAPVSNASSTAAFRRIVQRILSADTSVSPDLRIQNKKQIEPLESLKFILKIERFRINEEHKKPHLATGLGFAATQLICELRKPGAHAGRSGRASLALNQLTQYGRFLRVSAGELPFPRHGDRSS